LSTIVTSFYITRFARAESIRQLGYTYADMEKIGVIMPVVEVQLKVSKAGFV
jgi:acyl-CoA thioester hydrolase